MIEGLPQKGTGVLTEVNWASDIGRSLIRGLGETYGRPGNKYQNIGHVLRGHFETFLRPEEVNEVPSKIAQQITLPDLIRLLRESEVSPAPKLAQQ